MGRESKHEPDRDELIDEASEADALEQSREVADGDVDQPVPSSVDDLEVPEADALEQAQPVLGNDEEEGRDDSDQP